MRSTRRGNVRANWSAMAKNVRTAGAVDALGSGGKSRLLSGLGGGEMLESHRDLLRHRRGEERGEDGGLERGGVSEAPHLIEAHGSAPASEEELNLPANPVQLGDIVRREDLTRQGGQVVTVLAAERDADDAGSDRAALVVGDLDVEVEHGLLVDVTEGASLLQAQELAGLVGQLTTRALWTIGREHDGVHAVLEALDDMGPALNRVDEPLVAHEAQVPEVERILLPRLGPESVAV